jgi:hypothetical protein
LGKDITTNLSQYSANNSKQEKSHHPPPRLLNDCGSDTISELRVVHPAMQFLTGRDIVHWMTKIPGNLPLMLSTLPIILPSPRAGVPPIEQYPLMAYLAIFESPMKQLTDKGIFIAFIRSFKWFGSRSHRNYWKVRIRMS